MWVGYVQLTLAVPGAGIIAMPTPAFFRSSASLSVVWGPKITPAAAAVRFGAHFPYARLFAGWGQLEKYIGGNTNVAPDPGDFSLDALGPSAIVSGSIMLSPTVSFRLTAIDPILPNVGFGVLKVWNGSQWIQVPMRVYVDGNWGSKPVRVWSGSQWEEIDVTM
jgi:hypothetical protein